MDEAASRDRNPGRPGGAAALASLKVESIESLKVSHSSSYFAVYLLATEDELQPLQVVLEKVACEVPAMSVLLCPWMASVYNQLSVVVTTMPSLVIAVRGKVDDDISTLTKCKNAAFKVYISMDQYEVALSQFGKTSFPEAYGVLEKVKGDVTKTLAHALSQLQIRTLTNNIKT